MPTACTVREATAQDVTAVAQVHVDTWRETYAGLLPPALLDGLTVTRRAAMWTQVLAKASAWLFVAEDVSGVVGFCAVGPHRGDATLFAGEMGALYLLRRVQGQGVGCALWRAGGQRLAQQGLMPWGVWVLESNAAACRFYQRRGGVPAGHKTEHAGTAVLRECAFRWDSEPGPH